MRGLGFAMAETKKQKDALRLWFNLLKASKRDRTSGGYTDETPRHYLEQEHGISVSTLKKALSNNGLGVWFRSFDGTLGSIDDGATDIDDLRESIFDALHYDDTLAPDMQVLRDVGFLGPEDEDEDEDDKQHYDEAVEWLAALFGNDMDHAPFSGAIPQEVEEEVPATRTNDSSATEIIAAFVNGQCGVCTDLVDRNGQPYEVITTMVPEEDEEETRAVAAAAAAAATDAADAADAPKRKRIRPAFVDDGEDSD